MNHSFESLPRRIFLGSCTALTLRDYGGYICEGEPIPQSDRIRRIPDGIANVEALRNIFLINERALFEWIVSAASMQEAHEKRDPGHFQWLWDIADHSNALAGPVTVRSAGAVPALNVQSRPHFLHWHSQSKRPTMCERRKRRWSSMLHAVRANSAHHSELSPNLLIGKRPESRVFSE
jgi:hypothetical protein